MRGLPPRFLPMENIRSKLDLWLIVEWHFDTIYDTLYRRQGLCNVLNRLWEDEIITYNEMLALKMDIYFYKKARNRELMMYAWDDPLARKPRKMFIKKQILKAIKTT